MKLDSVGLEEVWAFLEFVGSESVDLKQQRDGWLEAIRKPESQVDDEHCLCKRYREDQTIPPSDELDLLLSAGWDLRRLLSRVYGDLVPPRDTLPSYDHANRYKALLDRFGIAENDSTILISLNYDTVLEDATETKTPRSGFAVTNTDSMIGHEVNFALAHEHDNSNEP